MSQEEPEQQPEQQPEEEDTEVKIAISFGTTRRNSQVNTVMVWPADEWAGMAEEARQSVILEYILAQGLFWWEFDYEHT